MSWINAHRHSESLAFEAERCMRSGDKKKALAIYKEAAIAEADALLMIEPDKQKTIGITAVSAVALYFKAKELGLAEKLAISCLSKEGLPPFAQKELKTIVQTIWNEQIFSASGVEFVRGELLVGVAGGMVAVGAAPLELVHRKVEEVKNLFFRAVELLLDMPLRRHGAPAQEIREQFRPWIIQAPAGSYQFALRVERPQQMDLFPSATLEIEEVTHKLFEIVTVASTSPAENLENVIPREDYRECFIKQVRNLAPTGKTFERLTIKSTGNEDLPTAIFSKQSRKILTDSIKAKEKTDPNQKDFTHKQLNGILRGVHLDKDWLEIIEEETGNTLRIHKAGDAIDDLVGPMVNHKVTVDVDISADGKHIFKDIQSFE